MTPQVRVSYLSVMLIADPAAFFLPDHLGKVAVVNIPICAPDPKVYWRAVTGRCAHVGVPFAHIVLVIFTA